MKKTLTTFTSSLFSLGAVLSSVSPANAQITNPVIGTLGSNVQDAESGGAFTRYFVNIWQALIVVGGLAVILYFVWGALEWILSGGDSGKVQKARDRMTQAGIGMIILVGSFAILGLISELFFGGFDILNPSF